MRVAMARRRSERPSWLPVSGDRAMEVTSASAWSFMRCRREASRPEARWSTGRGGWAYVPDLASARSAVEYSSCTLAPCRSAPAPTLATCQYGTSCPGASVTGCAADRRMTCAVA